MRKRPKHEPTEIYFYLLIQPAKCMVRSDAFNSYIDSVLTEMTGMQQIPILHVFLQTISNQNSSLRTKTYRRSVLWTKANQKVLSLMKFLRRRENHKSFTKS